MSLLFSKILFRIAIYGFMFFLISCSAEKRISLVPLPYPAERNLIVTADDFGASKNINEGIEIIADRGLITTVSVLSNFSESLPELKQFSVNHPEIEIGIHLNITTGIPVLEPAKVPSIITSSGSFFPIERLLPELRSISLTELEEELRAQILILKEKDIPVSYLSDQHGILSLYTPFFNIMTSLAKEFDLALRTPLVAGVEYPREFPHSHLKKFGRNLAKNFAIKHLFKAIHLMKYCGKKAMETKAQKLDILGIPHPGLLIEYFWGDPTPENLRYITSHLPDGSSELVLHVGTSSRQESYPSGLDVDYFKYRETELKTVLESFSMNNLGKMNIRPCYFREIK